MVSEKFWQKGKEIFGDEGSSSNKLLKQSRRFDFLYHPLHPVAKKVPTLNHLKSAEGRCKFQGGAVDGNGIHFQERFWEVLSVGFFAAPFSKTYQVW